MITIDIGMGARKAFCFGLLVSTLALAARAQTGITPRRGQTETTNAVGPSYVILQDSDENSLIRLSADGKRLWKIADHAAGIGLAQDHDGSYIVGARSKLLRVTPSGEVSTIAVAPGGAEWANLAVDSLGNILVVDGKQPALWKVSNDGQTVIKLASFNDITYTVGGRLGAVVADQSGDYFFLAGGYDRAGYVARFFRVSPSGQMTEIPLTGDRVACPVAMTETADEAFYVLPCRDARVLRLARSGDVRHFAQLPSALAWHSGGLTRNLVAEGVIVVQPREHRLVSTDGVHTNLMESAATMWRYLSYPVAIITEAHR